MNNDTMTIIELATELQQELKSGLSILEIMKSPVLKVIIKERFDALAKVETNLSQTFTPKQAISNQLAKLEKKIKTKSTKAESLKKTHSYSAQVREKIYNFIKTYPDISRTELAQRLDIRIQSVTARVNELLCDDRIYESGTKTDADSNRQVKVLSVKEGK